MTIFQKYLKDKLVAVEIGCRYVILVKDFVKVIHIQQKPEDLENPDPRDNVYTYNCSLVRNIRAPGGHKPLDHFNLTNVNCVVIDSPGNDEEIIRNGLITVKGDSAVVLVKNPSHESKIIFQLIGKIRVGEHDGFEVFAEPKENRR